MTFSSDVREVCVGRCGTRVLQTTVWEPLCIQTTEICYCQHGAVDELIPKAVLYQTKFNYKRIIRFHSFEIGSDCT
jgi:hypothetical protein